MKRKKLLCCLLVALIASCGGGGGGGGSDNSDAGSSDASDGTGDSNTDSDNAGTDPSDAGTGSDNAGTDSSDTGADGDSNNEPNDEIPKPSVQGKVGFSGLKNAVVCLDLNDDWTCDDNDNKTESDDNGQFSFTGLTEAQVNHRLIAVTTDNPTPLFSPAGTGETRNINLVTTLAEFSHQAGSNIADGLESAQSALSSSEVSTLGKINQTETANLDSNPTVSNYWRLIEGTYLYMMRGVLAEEYAVLNTLPQFPSLASEVAAQSLDTIETAVENTDYNWEDLQPGIHNWKADEIVTSAKFYRKAGGALVPEGVKDIEYISFGNDVFPSDDSEKTSLRINVKWNISDTNTLNDLDALAQAFEDYSLNILSGNQSIWSLDKFEYSWNEEAATGVYAEFSDASFDLFVRDPSISLNAGDFYQLALCKNDCNTGSKVVLATRKPDEIQSVSVFPTLSSLSALANEITLYTIDGATVDDGNITPVFAYLPLNYQQGKVRARLTLTDTNGGSVDDTTDLQRAISVFYMDTATLNSLDSASLRFEIRDNWEWEQSAWRLRTGENPTSLTTKSKGLTDLVANQIVYHNIWDDGEIGGWRDGYRIGTRHWFDSVKPVKLELIDVNDQIVGTVCLPSELPNRNEIGSFEEVVTDADGNAFSTSSDCGENTYDSVFKSEAEGWFDLMVSARDEWRVDDLPALEVSINGEIKSKDKMAANSNYASASSLRISYSDGTTETLKLPETKYEYQIGTAAPEKIQICLAANDRLRFIAQGPNELFGHTGTVSPDVRIRIQYQDGGEAIFDSEGAFGNSAAFIRLGGTAPEDGETLRRALGETDISRIRVSMNYADENKRDRDVEKTLELEIRDESYKAGELLNAPVCE